MTDAKDQGTVIGSDTVIKGEMTVENRARILGRFEGSIKSKGQLEVADKATCHAHVEASFIQIDGTMQGNVTASDKLQINATADLKGDVIASKLIVADGARVDGHFKVGPDAVKRGSAPAPSAAPRHGASSPQEEERASREGPSNQPRK